MAISEKQTLGGRGRKLSLVDVVAQSVGYMGPVFSIAFLVPLIVGLISVTGKGAGVAAPLGRRVSRPLPPADSPALLDLAALRAGDRLLIWVGRPASNATVIAFDIVDPVAGEALEHRHLFEDDRGAAVHAVPRRTPPCCWPGRWPTEDLSIIPGP